MNGGKLITLPRRRSFASRFLPGAYYRGGRQTIDSLLKVTIEFVSRGRVCEAARRWMLLLIVVNDVSRCNESCIVQKSIEDLLDPGRDVQTLNFSSARFVRRLFPINMIRHLFVRNQPKRMNILVRLIAARNRCGSIMKNRSTRNRSILGSVRRSISDQLTSNFPLPSPPRPLSPSRARARARNCLIVINQAKRRTFQLTIFMINERRCTMVGR